MRHLKLLLLGLGCLLVSVAQAQQSQEWVDHTFSDDTRISFPADFFIYDTQFNGILISNTRTDMFILTYYEGSQIYNEAPGDLQAALDRFIGSLADFEAGDADEITLGNRPGVVIDFSRTGDDGTTFEQRMMAVLVEENGTIVLFSVLPVDDSQLVEKDLIMEIAATLRTVEDDLGNQPWLGHVLTVADDVVIEYPDGWQPAAAPAGWEASLRSDTARMDLVTFTPDERDALGLKPDEVDVLGYQFQPFDASLRFDAEALTWIHLNGERVLRYTFEDRRDGQPLNRAYLVMTLSNGTYVVAGLQAVETHTVDDPAPLYMMLTTVRLQSEPSHPVPVLDRTFRLPDGTRLGLSYRWFPELEEDRGGVSLVLQGATATAYLFPYTADEVQDEGYDGPLPETLIDLIGSSRNTTLDTTTVTTITLPSGRSVARVTYIVTVGRDEQFEVTSAVMRLQHGGLMFLTIGPNEGLETVGPRDINEIFVILDSVAVDG